MESFEFKNSQVGCFLTSLPLPQPTFFLSTLVVQLYLLLSTSCLHLLRGSTQKPQFVNVVDLLKWNPSLRPTLPQRKYSTSCALCPLSIHSITGSCYKKNLTLPQPTFRFALFNNLSHSLRLFITSPIPWPFNPWFISLGSSEENHFQLELCGQIYLHGNE